MEQPKESYSSGRALLSDYDSESYGPLFAVSDEGSAGRVVVDAAYASAKYVSDPCTFADPLRLGMILDGERMNSAGEFPVGPPEYAALIASTQGLVPLTTNVGVRVNVRLANQLPEFSAGEVSAAGVVSAFQPFLHTPDGRPRPLTVRLQLEDADPEPLGTLVDAIEQARKRGELASADVHRLSALVIFPNEISSVAQLLQIEEVISAAARVGITEVAIDGTESEYARRRWGGQGLLNVLSVAALSRLLEFAEPLGVKLVPRYCIDVESAARTIWTGLEAARANGLDAGKYGLLPLTLEEQLSVIERVTRWTVGWTAIPAYYVDAPLVTATEVFDIDRSEEAARRWLKAARGAGATLVLFDAPDRISPHKLVKSPDGAKGVLTPDEIRSLIEYAKVLGVRILWSGGITPDQAFQLSQCGAHGIFSTSSTASRIPVSAEFSNEQAMASENEPTIFGVRRMHAIVQAGFLGAKLFSQNQSLAQELLATTEQLIAVDAPGIEGPLRSVDALLVSAWRHFRESGPAPSLPARHFRDGVESQPVPADAVRVFRGRRRSTMAPEKFVERLSQVFMPLTVQMQRLHGLTAYLPALLPQTGPEAVPLEEVALVFYRTQGSYHEAKRSVGGRSYSELHEIAFDMAESKSGFPLLLDQDCPVSDQPYHLFEESVDWQSGTTQISVRTRSREFSPDRFLGTVGAAARKLRMCPGSLDAAVFVATTDWLIWWEHAARSRDSPTTVFDHFTNLQWLSTAKQVDVPEGLDQPYLGLPITGDAGFFNLRFSRIWPK